MWIAMAAASASATSLFLPSSFKLNAPTKNFDTLRFPLLNRRSNGFRIAASVSVSNPNVRTGPDDLVASILSKVKSFYCEWFIQLSLICSDESNLWIEFYCNKKSFLLNYVYCEIWNKSLFSCSYWRKKKLISQISKPVFTFESSYLLHRVIPGIETVFFYNLRESNNLFFNLRRSFS